VSRRVGRHKQDLRQETETAFRSTGVTGSQSRWARTAYYIFPALTVVAVMVGSRWPIAFIPYVVVVAVVGLYLVLSGGGIWRRQFDHPAAPGAFRILGVMIIATGIGFPAVFLLRANRSHDPVLWVISIGCALVVAGGVITLYRRYRGALRGQPR
jgi:hypothetical protein